MACVDGVFGSVDAETVNVADLEIAVAGDKDVLLTTVNYSLAQKRVLTARH